MQVHHLGNISLPSLTVSNVYLVPSAFELTFVEQLCDMGFELHISKCGCDV